MLTAFRPGAVVAARAASPFPAQIFIAPDGRHSSRRRADNPSAPSTRVFNARGTRSFLRAVRGIGPVRVRLSASFSEALMQTQEIFGIGIG